MVYNASNNELVRTKTLVKNCVVAIDATPFRTWFESHYHAKVDKTPVPAAEGAPKQSEHAKAKFAARAKAIAVDPRVVEQFSTGRLLATLTSRPGQSGRADGQILEGDALEFYLKKLAVKKSGKAVKVSRAARGRGGKGTAALCVLLVLFDFLVESL